MSLYYPCNYPAKEAISMTAAAAVAVCQSIEAISHRTARIKWVNDVYLDGKKVCGILTEGTLTPDGSGDGYAIIGIGVNIGTPDGGFPADIAKKATAVFPDSQDASHRKIVLAAAIINRLTSFLAHLDRREFADEYITRSFLPGQDVHVIRTERGDTADAKVLAVEPDFQLRVRYQDGSEELLYSGEVTIRLHNP